MEFLLLEIKFGSWNFKKLFKDEKFKITKQINKWNNNNNNENNT